MMAAPVNYSTQISAVKTVGEMQEMLAKHGARRIAVDYENGQPSGLSFMLATEIGDRLFSLPVNIAAIHQLLKDKDARGELRSGSKAVRTSREQAERVAWRIMKDWLGAMLALIDSRMVTLSQILLPYMHVNEHNTLYDAFKARELEAGSNG